jgi:hypothetical protein
MRPTIDQWSVSASTKNAGQAGSAGAGRSLRKNAISASFRDHALQEHALAQRRHVLARDPPLARIACTLLST